MRNRRNKNIKNIKDYIVPIGILLVFIFLLYLGLSWGDDSNTVSNWNNSWEITTSIPSNALTITLEDNSDGVIINSKEKEMTLTSGQIIQPWEKLVMKQWAASVSVPWIAEMNLDGRLVYNKDWSMKLDSSSLWLRAKQDYELGMNYVTVKAEENSVVNLVQNEVSSTVYLIKWTAEVETLSGVSTFLSPWKKIQITNRDTSKDDLDITLLKEDIDDYFKTEDWYIKNNDYSEVIAPTEVWGEENSSSEGTWSGATLTLNASSALKSSVYGSILNFDSIYDEWSVDKSASLISGNYIDSNVTKILIDWRAAQIDAQKKTFSLWDVDTSQAVNDIVVKVYDNADNVIGKYVYTLYYSGGQATAATDSPFTAPKVYQVNPSDFIVSSPTVKNGTSYSDLNTIYWTVKNKNVTGVTVNGYRLKSYNGLTWRYHAFKAQNTLGEWVNNYTIRYLGAGGKVIYTKYFRINKKTVQSKKAAVVAPKAVVKKVVSAEANPQ